MFLSCSGRALQLLRWRGEGQMVQVVNGLKCREEDVGIDTVFDGELKKLQEDGCDVVDVRGSADDAGS